MSVDRSTAPAYGPSPAVSLPAVRRDRMDNGIDLVALPVDGPPVVVLEAVLGAGSALDPPGSAGLADLTAHLLPEGAAGMGMIEIAERLGGLGARLSVGAGHDAAWLGVTALASNLAPALELLADLVLRPDWPPDEIERLLQEREVDLLSERDQPAIVAARAFSAELYGPGHPYGQPTSGTLASVRGLTRDAFAAFYERAYRPVGASLLAVGRIDPVALGPAARAAFGAWEGGPPPVADVDPPADPGRGIVLVDRPDSAQSELRVGHVGVARGNPDEVPLRALNHLLGGAFHSRINLNLRERQGWTYGARTRFSFRRGAGPFVVGTSVALDATRPALEEIAGEIERAAAGPIEPAERDLAVHGIVRGLPRMFEGPSRVAARVRELVVYDLPDDHWDGYGARFERVGVEDLERVAAEHLHPDRLLNVVVGDAAAVEADLAALGDVRRRDRKAAAD